MMDERLRALGYKEFDVAQYLDTPEVVADFLSDALAENDPEYFEHALALAARARAMHGFSQSSSPTIDERCDGGKTLEATRRELQALGMKLQIAAA